MKRILLLAAAAVLLASPAMSQGTAVKKLNKATILRDIEKSNSNIADSRQNAKAATWITRGNLFIDAAMYASENLFKGADAMTLELMLGKPSQTAQQGDYEVRVYPRYDLYMLGGLLDYWKEKDLIDPSALEKATEAFEKAYQLDARQKSKITPRMELISNIYMQNADNEMGLKQMAASAVNFDRAYQVLANPLVGKPDYAVLFNAGYLYAAAADFNKAVTLLDEAVRKGYEKDGDTYYYLGYSYLGLKDFAKAKEVLYEGLAKYPQNDNIMEGLMAYYEETKEDPQEILETVQKKLEADPDNASLLIGMMRLYDQMGETDKAYDAAAKLYQLHPNDFVATYNYGYFVLRKADLMQEQVNATPVSSMAEAVAARKAVLDKYAEAVVPLEKAHSLNPTDYNTLSLLTGITFRLREDPAMQAKYDKYKALFDKLQAE